jgi:hypothetical protein
VLTPRPSLAAQLSVEQMSTHQEDARADQGNQREQEHPVVTRGRDGTLTLRRCFLDQGTGDHHGESTRIASGDLPIEAMLEEFGVSAAAVARRPAT